ncbi:MULTISPECIES: LysR substrate-binding domain-containing protein [Methylobacterium]|jgi:DNA-binding transcriptional LysR family regulator|uniref:LysR substrate-binding domain-containing protein n=1 Tax=Methylobacterium TaxID=407 RepID=UPI0008F01C4B|nr:MULTISPECIES: LysR substrate-binding domain-containing protein [Methylobacterium]MBZ6411761.1 LysR family transcriptional regulator [Methylobacterium sp.]MBK3396190.1 LysR family transcriptional regulator [Methylobacterium ajmalii]MBK3410127.1 LysR family transcriptional regulator [Methylobacterium ajmalii]MBK3421854.1 LysR family transcriptional regulator [Methylobacterium ajmalii]SFE45491.1 DNA-binding transcriptional regulator, LysR family [Methylobacterium sp. yr596]
MDNRLGEMEAFVEVARRASFAAAAKALRRTPSAVSRAVARLEARLGVALIRRTTRSMTLTPEGELYLRRAAELIAEFAAIEDGFGREAAVPTGLLRVNASVPFGTKVILPVLPRFLAEHPRMRVDLALTDDVVDLVEARADVAIRIGPLRDTSLRARRLGRSRLAVVASPAYLARAGTPAHPDALADHNCLAFSFRRSLDTWPFLVDGAVSQRPVRGNFLGNSGEVARRMALGGAGLARLARFHVEDDLLAGRLVPVLEAFSPGDAEDIHALYAGQERLSRRIRCFVDFLAAHAALRD